MNLQPQDNQKQDNKPYGKYGKYSSFLNYVVYFVILVLTFFIIKACYGIVLNEEKNVNDKNSNLEQRKADLDKYSKLKEQMPTFPATVAKLEKVASYAKEKNMVQFLAQLETITSSSNLIISSIAPESKEGKNQIKITFRGNSFDNFKNFLNDLENNMYVFDVVSMSYSTNSARLAEQNQSSGGDINFSAVVKIAG